MNAMFNDAPCHFFDAMSDKGNDFSRRAFHDFDQFDTRNTLTPQRNSSTGMHVRHARVTVTTQRSSSARTAHRIANVELETLRLRSCDIPAAK